MDGCWCVINIAININIYHHYLWILSISKVNDFLLPNKEPLHHDMRCNNKNISLFVKWILRISVQRHALKNNGENVFDFHNTWLEIFWLDRFWDFSLTFHWINNCTLNSWLLFFYIIYIFAYFFFFIYYLHCLKGR